MMILLASASLATAQCNVVTKLPRRLPQLHDVFTMLPSAVEVQLIDLGI